MNEENLLQITFEGKKYEQTGSLKHGETDYAYFQICDPKNPAALLHALVFPHLEIDDLKGNSVWEIIAEKLWPGKFGVTHSLRSFTDMAENNGVPMNVTFMDLLEYIPHEIIAEALEYMLVRDAAEGITGDTEGE